NMDIFQRAFAMFTPFARHEGQGEEANEAAKADHPVDEIDDLKRQLEEIQKRLDRLSAAEADKTKA
ncbi:MAG: polyhydroxyalkanoate synthesis repressor PhaR, partial [Rhodoplanes sp.]